MHQQANVRVFTEMLVSCHTIFRVHFECRIPAYSLLVQLLQLPICLYVSFKIHS